MTTHEHSRLTHALGLAPLAILALVFGLTSSFAASGVAFAHAGYDSSDPAAGAILKTAPTVVTIHFKEQVNPTGSDIVIYDAKHQQVSTAPAQVTRTDLKTMTVPMKGNGSEIYLVVWHNVSADDGDPDTSAFTFSVSKDATPPAGSSNNESGQSATASGSGGTPGWVVALVGVVGLVLGGLGGSLLGRHR
jgi:methionine-rich copper-binding protein CopC